jgi:hypothetical protein
MEQELAKIEEEQQLEKERQEKEAHAAKLAEEEA